MYSILCRHANFGQRVGDASDYTPAESHNNGGIENLESGGGLATNLRRFIEKRDGVKYFLFFTIMLGTGLVIGDGILTPAISGRHLYLHSYFQFYEEMVPFDPCFEVNIGNDIRRTMCRCACFIECCCLEHPVVINILLALLCSALSYGRNSERGSVHLYL